LHFACSLVGLAFSFQLLVAEGLSAKQMDENRLSGTAKNLGGKIEEFAGKVTGDAKVQVEGKLKQAVGTMQNLYGQARDATSETAGDAIDAIRDQAHTLDEVLQNTVETRPYLSVTIALGVGIALGAGIGRRR
jgi:uncharacterized protein YjbJ (UPF0337 family)